MEAQRRDKEKALLKARGVIKVRWCGDESEHSAPLWFPANVTLFQTRRVVWLLLLTGLKETREPTRVELMHAIAKKEIGGLYATSLFSVVQTQQRFICVHPKGNRTCIQVPQSGSNQAPKMNQMKNESNVGIELSFLFWLCCTNSFAKFRSLDAVCSAVSASLKKCSGFYLPDGFDAPTLTIVGIVSDLWRVGMTSQRAVDQNRRLSRNGEQAREVRGRLHWAVHWAAYMENEFMNFA